jgi:hypothetical protein
MPSLETPYSVRPPRRQLYYRSTGKLICQWFFSPAPAKFIREIENM